MNNSLNKYFLEGNIIGFYNRAIALFNKTTNHADIGFDINIEVHILKNIGRNPIRAHILVSRKPSLEEKLKVEKYVG